MGKILRAMKLLIVEDETELRRMMAETLREAGYVVETARTYAEAEEKLHLYEYDCILLDLMLPDGDGLELLRMLSGQGSAARVIITSAKDSVEDKVAGLDLGADDYLPKPFHLAELAARVRSLIRRSGAGTHRIEVGNVSLNPDDRSAAVEGKPLNLLHKEYHILYYFMTRPGRVVDKQVLAEAVWGDHADQSDNFSFLYQQVANLKRKLKEAGASVAIQAVYGFGYKLVEEGERS